jgi:hypothetical protein
MPAKNAVSQLPEQTKTEGFYAELAKPVDYAEWVRTSMWSAEQAIALSFDLEPADVKWDAIDARAVTSRQAVMRSPSFLGEG